VCDYRFSLIDSDFQNQTRGLFGNWSHDVTDDFVLPDGRMAGVGTTINNFESIHRDFALHCEYTKDNDTIYICFQTMTQSYLYDHKFTLTFKNRASYI